jgi:thiosulfate/3-mercaptopyruvate sulfurtransferase
MDSLVTTQWLAEDMAACDLRIVDAAATADAGRNARDDYETGHIPGAVFMDLAGLVDPAAPVENTLPAPEIRQPDAGAGAGRWQPHRAVR